jgi:hypothetical protein
MFASFGHLAFNANNLPVRFILSWRNNVFSVEKTSEKLLDMSGGIRVCCFCVFAQLNVSFRFCWITELFALLVR